jgi:hypothetical protein
MDHQSIEYHLSQAISHLKNAINESVKMLTTNKSSKKEVGQKWEWFLGQFFSYIREKGKESRINLLGLISFPRQH